MGAAGPCSPAPVLALRRRDLARALRRRAQRAGDATPAGDVGRGKSGRRGGCRGCRAQSQLQETPGAKAAARDTGDGWGRPEG
jgi:hypothetical protein